MRFPSIFLFLCLQLLIPQVAGLIPEVILAGLLIKKLVHHGISKEECAALARECQITNSNLEGDAQESKAILDQQDETYRMQKMTLERYRARPDQWDCSYKSRPPLPDPPKLRSLHDESTLFETDKSSTRLSSTAAPTSTGNSSSAAVPSSTGSSSHSKPHIPGRGHKGCPAYDTCFDTRLKLVQGAQNQRTISSKQTVDSDTLTGFLRDCWRIPPKTHIQRRKVDPNEIKQVDAFTDDCRMRLTQARSFLKNQVDIITKLERGDLHHNKRAPHALPHIQQQKRDRKLDEKDKALQQCHADLATVSADGYTKLRQITSKYSALALRHPPVGWKPGNVTRREVDLEHEPVETDHHIESRNSGLNMRDRANREVSFWHTEMVQVKDALRDIGHDRDFFGHAYVDCRWEFLELQQKQHDGSTKTTSTATGDLSKSLADKDRMIALLKENSDLKDRLRKYEPVSGSSATSAQSQDKTTEPMSTESTSTESKSQATTQAPTTTTESKVESKTEMSVPQDTTATKPKVARATVF